MYEKHKGAAALQPLTERYSTFVLGELAARPHLDVAFTDWTKQSTASSSFGIRYRRQQ